MRVFNAFMILVASVFLWLMPISDAIYDFRTDQETDNFTVTTAVGVTAANVTLLDTLYDNDTSTISYISSIAETPTFYSYNSTTRTVWTTGLTANTSRTLTVYYDRSALAGNTTLETVLDWTPYIYYLILAAFPVCGLAAIFIVRRF